MRKIVFLGSAALVLSGVFTSCKKSSNDDTNGGTSGDSIYVNLSTAQVEYNNFDYVVVTVKDKNGSDITSSCSILLNNTTAINSKFVPSGLGTFTIKAKKGSQPSDSTTLTVVPKSASPFTQKILVEDMTGAWCGFCTRVANHLENYTSSNPECIVVGIHGGGGTDPFKFQYYPTFNTQFGISGYPTAILNRKSEWGEEDFELDNALRAWAPVGLAINSTLNGNTVTGSVKVKYGVNTEKSMKLVIALVENGLVYPQVNYYSPQYGATPYLYGGVSPVTNFVHKAVLRRTATDLFGDAIPTAVQTKNNIHEVSFSIPLTGSTYGGGSYTAVGNNCAIVAFVVDGSTQNNGAYNVQYAPVGTNQNFD